MWHGRRQNTLTINTKTPHFSTTSHFVFRSGLKNKTNSYISIIFQIVPQILYITTDSKRHLFLTFKFWLSSPSLTLYSTARFKENHLLYWILNFPETRLNYSASDSKTQPISYTKVCECHDDTLDTNIINNISHWLLILLTCFFFLYNFISDRPAKTSLQCCYLSSLHMLLEIFIHPYGLLRNCHFYTQYGMC